MFKMLCVTNRNLCKDEETFLLRIEEIAKEKPEAIILREKDLSPQAYAKLAEQVMEICKAYHVPCILHSFVKEAMILEAEGIHLPLPILRTMKPEEKEKFRYIGASCHSVEDAVYAWKSGCTYITAGHIFETDCKKGLPGRGLDFLKEICEQIPIPVYGIGGIEPENIEKIVAAGAAGGCMMSSLMICEDIQKQLCKK